jgi:hypothetical protein
LTPIQSLPPQRARFELDGQENWIVIDQIRTLYNNGVIKTVVFLAEGTIKQGENIFKETFHFLKRQKTVISNLLANPPFIVVGLSY